MRFLFAATCRAEHDAAECEDPARGGEAHDVGVSQALVRIEEREHEHLRGVPWARIGEAVGQRNLAVTANTYTHVLSDGTEIDYERLIRARTVRPSVLPTEAEIAH